MHLLPFPLVMLSKLRFIWQTFAGLLLYPRPCFILWEWNKDRYDTIPAFKEFIDSEHIFFLLKKNLFIYLFFIDSEHIFFYLKKFIYLFFIDSEHIFKWTATHSNMCTWVLSCFSRVWLFATPWAVASPGSSLHGILQARILEQVAISFSRRSFQLRDRTCISFVSCIGRQVLYC